MVTNYKLSRKERMDEYLDFLKEEANRINGDESVIWLAKDFLNLLTNKLSQQNKVLEVPDCCPSNGSQGDFHIMFTWDKNEHYLECEITNSGLVEFFYRNHLTKEVWGCDTDSRSEVLTSYTLTEADISQKSNELLDKLSLFVE